IKSQVDKQDDYLIQLKYLENDYQKITREELQLSERYEMFVQREKMFNQKVLDEQKNYEFLTNIDPIHWPELLITLKKLKEKESYKNNNYEETNQETIEEKKLLNKEIDYYQNEISALFELASVENEEDFYKTYYEYKEQKRLINQIENYYNQLKTSFDERQLEALLTINQDEYDLNQKINNYKNEITKIDSEINDLREKIATLDAEIKQMEETEAYSEVLHKLSYKKAKAK